jgi:hypothetical protein
VVIVKVPALPTVNVSASSLDRQSLIETPTA